MTEPRNNRGASRQDYETPWELIRAVERLFGKLAWDLACTEENKKAPQGITIEQDSLAQDWSKLDGHLWLNPPFADIAPWAKKCAESRAKVTMLVPASIDSKWFAEWVRDYATVYAVAPRIPFNGQPFPKPCMLCLYGERLQQDHTYNLLLWRWK